MPIEVGELIIRATATSQRMIEIDGAKLGDDLDAQLESVVVTDRMAMADTFAIIFRDPGKTILKDAGCEIGKA